MNIDRTSIKNWLKENLEPERYAHVIASENVAIELAQRFGADAEQSGLAALLHDCAKNIENEKLYSLIEENNIEVTKMELLSCKTLHAPVGAFIAKKLFAVEDKEILDAIRYHTIGRVGMSMIEKIVFLADKIEEATRDKQYIEKVRVALDINNNIDDAIIICYESTINSLIKRRLVINPQTIEVYNHLIVTLNQ